MILRSKNGRKVGYVDLFPISYNIYASLNQQILSKIKKVFSAKMWTLMNDFKDRFN